MNPKIIDWSGKRVWLVGASSGIGAALAGELARRGARVALSARNVDKLRALDIEGALLLPCDATDTASLASARASLLAAWDGVDLVVYLAGDYVPMRADGLRPGGRRAGRRRQFQRRHAPGRDRAARPAGRRRHRLRRQCRRLPRAAQGAGYGPGKAALIHFAECLHLDLAPQGIGVWVINPGFVATPLTAKNDFAMPALLTPEQAALAMRRRLANGQFRDPLPEALYPGA